MIGDKKAYREYAKLFTSEELCDFEKFLADPLIEIAFTNRFLYYCENVFSLLTYTHKHILFRYYFKYIKNVEKLKFLKKEKNFYIIFNKLYHILVSSFDAKFFDYILKNDKFKCDIEFLNLPKFKKQMKNYDTTTAQCLIEWDKWLYHDLNELDKLASHWSIYKNVKYIRKKLNNSIPPAKITNISFLHEYYQFDTANYIKNNAIELYNYNGDVMWYDVFDQCISITMKLKLYIMPVFVNITLRSFKNIIKNINYIVDYYNFYGNIDIIYSHDYRLFCQKNHKNIIISYQKATLQTKNLISFDLIRYLCQSYYINIPISTNLIILVEQLKNKKFYWGFSKKQYDYIIKNNYNPYNCKSCTIKNNTIVHHAIVKNEAYFTGKVPREGAVAEFCRSWTFSFTFGMTFFEIPLALKNELQKTIENFESIILYRGMKFIGTSDYTKFLAQNGFITNTFNSWSPDINTALSYTGASTKNNNPEYNYFVLLKRKFARDELLMYFRNLIEDLPYVNHTDEYIAMPGNYHDVEITILD
jgi:hypothetical protein